MALSRSETSIRCSAEAAKVFVDWYYQSVNEGKPVAGAYVTNNATYRASGHPPSDICANGLVVATPEEWDQMLAQQRFIPANAAASAATTSTTIGRSPPSAVNYDVECYDAHVINPDFRFAAPPALLTDGKAHGSGESNGAGVRMMVMVSVSGTVTFGLEKDAPKQHFSDVFILVPNWDVIAKHGSRGTRRYIVASQTYRAY
ncbi:hypothetical protein B0H67DRAFT_643030 [Lasiosphaeris hirsuta]|uniref:NTF2 domain-containing protein n=1 Tax=Lasiosphaeris hirsuta TaxID=260670 RepID=A0AA40APP2_9PEZI|nr:hypothetical protein B0H67DRAFT_643030 [Lasiosphaeris hirsuta]